MASSWIPGNTRGLHHRYGLCDGAWIGIVVCLIDVCKITGGNEIFKGKNTPVVPPFLNCANGLLSG